MTIRIGRCRWCGGARHDGECQGMPTVIASTAEEIKEATENTPWHAMRDQLTEQYGKMLGLFLAKRFATLLRGKDLSCMDQMSWVELPSKPEHKLSFSFMDAVYRHNKIRKSGCCGSADMTVTHNPSGRVFAFGFNYGH